MKIHKYYTYIPKFIKIIAYIYLFIAIGIIISLLEFVLPPNIISLSVSLSALYGIPFIPEYITRIFIAALYIIISKGLFQMKRWVFWLSLTQAICEFVVLHAVAILTKTYLPEIIFIWHSLVIILVAFSYPRLNQK